MKTNRILMMSVALSLAGCQLISQQAGRLQAPSASSRDGASSLVAASAEAKQALTTPTQAKVAFTTGSPTGPAAAQFDPNKPNYVTVQFNIPYDPKGKHLFGMLVADADVHDNQFESLEERRTVCTFPVRLGQPSSTWTVALTPDVKSYQGQQPQEREELECLKNLHAFVKGPHTLDFKVSSDNMDFLSRPGEVIGSGSVKVDLDAKAQRILQSQVVQLDCAASGGRTLPRAQTTSRAVIGPAEKALRSGLRAENLSLAKLVVDDDGWHDKRNDVTGILLSRDMHVALGAKDDDGACWMMTGAIYQEHEGSKFGPTRAELRDFTKEPMCCTALK